MASSLNIICVIVGNSLCYQGRNATDRLIMLHFLRLSTLIFLSFQTYLFAVPYPVTTVADSGGGSLRQGIIDVNTNVTAYDSFDFSGIAGGTIILSSPLPLINDSGGFQSIMGFSGNNVTINGAGAHPGMWLKTGTILIDNLHFSNCLSGGGNGGSPGGGGAAGIGSALLVDSASVIVNDVSFIDCKNLGGNGGNGSAVMSGGGGGGALAWLTSKNGSDAVGMDGSVGGGGAFGGIGGVGASGGDSPARSGGGGGGGANGFSGGNGFSGAFLDAFIGGGGGSGSFGGGSVPGNPGVFGGGGGALLGSSDTSSPNNGFGFFTSAGSGGATGTLPGATGGAGGGGSAAGVIYVTSSGSLEIRGNTFFQNSMAEAGLAGSQMGLFNPNLAAEDGTTTGVDIAYYSSMPLLVDSSEDVTFSRSIEAFNPFGLAVLNKEGTGTLTLETVPRPEGDSQNSVTYRLNSINLNEGTIHFLGQQPSETTSGFEFFVSNLFLTNELSIGPNTTFRGTGLVTVGTQFTNNGTIDLDIGTFFTALGAGAPDPVFGSNSKIQTTIKPKEMGSLFFASSPLFPNNFDFSLATLEMNIPPGNFPTVPTVYIPLLTTGLITEEFNQILVNGNPETDQAFYSPPNAPNSLFVPVGVPEGYIGPANLVFGVNSIPSTILMDPCGGLVVLAFLFSQEQAEAALTSFFLNQSNLTIQALGGSATFINNQFSKRRAAAGSAGAAGPVAAWRREKEHGYLAHNDTSFVSSGSRGDDEMNLAFGPLKPEDPKYSIYISPFAQFQQQDAVSTSTASFSSYETISGGATLGFDYLGMETILVGGAATYVYTDLEQEKDLGKAQIHSAFGTFYSGFIFDQLTLNLVATGSYNYNSSSRNFPAVPGETFTFPQFQDFEITSTGIPGGTALTSYNSYQLVPHFDLSYEIGFDWISILPFIQSDTVISFQDCFKESGAGEFAFSACDINVSLNTANDFLITFLLQNEAGINLFEQVKWNAQDSMIFRQKASYVNRYIVPYTSKSRFLQDTQFVETSISFPMQHFFGTAFEMILRMGKNAFILSYEGMFGSGYLFNTAYIRYSYDF